MDWLVDFLLNFYGPTPYLIIFGILLLCGFGLPIPEDITLFAGGLLAYYGVCNLGLMIVVCFVGVMVGDSLMWFFGRKYGRQILKIPFFHRLLPDERIAVASQKLNSVGSKRILFVGRFMPGLRAPIYFTSGLLHVPFHRFFMMDGLAALISVPAFVGSVYYFGDELDSVVRWIKKIEHGIVLLVLGAVLVLVFRWWRSRRRPESGRPGVDRRAV
jgi:membrane protein DedA with SNARE-associated domain